MSQDDQAPVRVAPKDQQLRPTPQNELDLQLMTTDPKWGDWQIPDELKEVLGHAEVFQDEEGRQYVDISSLWGLLGFYTRDIRLGNLPFWSGEVGYVENHIDFAGDSITGLQLRAPKRLPEGVEEAPKQARTMHFIGSFMRTFRPAITKLEVSQSRGGFLRRRQGTLTSENIQSQLEPKKKGLLSGKKGGYEQ